MKRNHVYALFLAALITTSVLYNDHFSSFAIRNSLDVLPSEKLSSELIDKMEDCNDEELPVVLWLDEIDQVEIETKIKDSIGYNLDDLEVDYPSPSPDLICELSKAAQGNPTSYLSTLMVKHMELTAPARKLEKERTDLYQSTRLSVVKDLNSASINGLLDAIEISAEKIKFISSYAPMILCLMTPDEILSVCENAAITDVDYYSPLDSVDCLIDFGTTKATVGIDRINSILSLNGNGVNIGIYESTSASYYYYPSYGLSTSQVSIVGTPYNNQNYHSAYCAGIAAGSNGIAPSAHIYSASNHSDFSDFDFIDYNNAVLPNLELLLGYVHLVSMSFGIQNQSTCYNYLSKYIDHLIAQTGKTMVCATGNSPIEYVNYPASAYNCIAVNGFIDVFDNNPQELLNDYTYNHGTGCYKPDVIAPSLNNGTSTATPYIAGMIALMYQYKPSLAARPELTKAILMGSCHRKCSQYVTASNNIYNLTETMEQGLTNRQGAGIPDMYCMISIVSQHTYGNGILDSSNNYERKINFVQPTYNSAKINVTMVYLQTNVPSGSVPGAKDDYDLSLTNNNTVSTSNMLNTSAEMIYKSLSLDANYEIHIYKYSGQSTSVRYGYAWSTDNERFYNNHGDEGVYYLKNYKSGYYLSRNSTSNKAMQTSYSNSHNNLWIIDNLSTSNNSNSLKCANILSNGLGKGGAISSNNYYALEGSNASVASIEVNYNSADGTYCFKRMINGATYALGIYGQSTSLGAYANWAAYDANNSSQKWYLEAASYRSGDADYNGTIQSNDSYIASNALSTSFVYANNLQQYLLDADKDNSVSISDLILINQIIAGN